MASKLLQDGPETKGAVLHPRHYQLEKPAPHRRIVAFLLGRPRQFLAKENSFLPHLRLVVRQ